MNDVVVLRRHLAICVAIVAGLGLVAEIWHVRAPGASIEALLPKLSLSYEGNLPTWFSSSLLLVCALAAARIARTRPPWHRHWWGITAMLGWMSLDEAAELHEHLGGLVGTHGLFYFDWVIPAAGVVLAVALVYWPFLRALAGPTRTRLVVAAAIYVTGALVMELPLGWWTDHHGDEGLVYALIDWVEETLEMLGASLALAALVAHVEEEPRA